MNLVRLHKLTGEPTYRARADQLFRLFSSRLVLLLLLLLLLLF
jgi:hypothetical protein